MRSLKIYLYSIVVYLKCRMEYRFSFFMQFFVQIFSFFLTYLGIWIIFDKFHQLQGWSYYEVVFLYNLNLVSYGLAGLLVWSATQQLGEMIQQGTFDSILAYPLNPLLHLTARGFNPSFFGHLILGGIVFAMCFGQLDIAWTVTKFAWFILVIVGATLIQISLMIVSGTASFWIVKSTALVDVTIYGLRRFIEYPITIYNKWLQIVLTFVVPYAFVNFFPAQYFLNGAGEYEFHPAFQFGTPAVGVAMFFLAYRLWGFGVNHYQSTGS